jgi:DNA polymerase-1
MTLTTTKTEIPFSDLAFEDWIRLIQRAKILSFDTETTGLEVYDGTDTMTGFSIAFATDLGILEEYFPVYHDSGENLPEDLAFALLREIVKKPMIMHNAPFDLSVLYHLGLPLPEKFFDTMKLDHLINENYGTYKLDATTKRWLGYEGKEKSPLFNAGLLAYGWAKMPSHLMYDYAKADASITFRSLVAMQKSPEMRPELVKYWQEIEAPTTTLLAKMRRRGVKINLDLCKEQELKGKAIMEEITDKLGGNPGSPVMLKKLFWEELGLPVIYGKNKRPTFDKEAMKRYEVLLERKEGTEGNEVARDILRYRGWQKAVSGYYESYQRHISNDGRLRAEYRATGTVTGRFSCANPNLQQIPKETDKEWNGRIKTALIGESGYKLWELDYSQLEFRLAASASKEQRLLEIFNDPDRDIFDEMAAQLGMERQATKTLTYSIQYGAGKQRIQDVFGVNEYEAIDIIDNFYETYPGLKIAGQKFGQQAKRAGFVDIWSGRRRHFMYPQSEYYKAFNSYVQGGAADLVKMVMVDIDKNIDDDQECRMLLQVHDSLVFEIREGREDYYLPLLAEAMTKPDFGVRLAVDAHSWAK